MKGGYEKKGAPRRERLQIEAGFIQARNLSSSELKLRHPRRPGKPFVHSVGKNLFHRKIQKIVQNIAFMCLILVACLLETPAFPGGSAHGIAMHGQPALTEGFANLPYANPHAPRGGRVVYGETGSFDSLNPFILKGRAPWALAGLTVETLLARSWDEPFTLYGLLAESVETPPDRSWVRFVLREGARFSDGTPVTIEDVIWSIETLGRDGHPRYRAAAESIARIEPSGPRGVTIRFSESNRELPLIMGLRPILKKADWQGRDFTASTLTPLTGSGPYVVADFEPGRFVEFARDPDWWGAGLAINRGMHNFDRVRFDYYRDADALWSAVRTGAVSIFADRDPVRWVEGYDFPAARQGRLIRHEIGHGRPSGMEGFVFNTRRAPFDDRRVRRALALAFDWRWINQRLFAGQYERIASYWSGSPLGFDGPAKGREAALLAPFADTLPEGTLVQGWRPPEGDGARNRANLGEAARLLEVAGWRAGQAGRVRDGRTLDFEILVASTEHETLATLWSKALARIGVTARVRRVDDAQYRARRQVYDYDVTVNRWWLSLSPGTEQWLYFGSEGRETPGTRNYMGVAEPAVDAMIRALLAASDRPDFAAAVRALDRVLSAGVYVVPFGVLAEDRIAAGTAYRRPERGTLYGFRPEVWWQAPQD